MNDITEVNKLPSNPEAEKNIIGQTILDRHLSVSARELNITDFYSPFYRALWGAFLELDADGLEIEPISAFQIFKRDNPDLGLQFKLFDVVDATKGMIHGFNPNVYVKQVQNCAARRYLIRELSAQIGRLIESEDLHKAKSDIENQFADINMDGTGNSQFQSLADIVERDVKPALLDLRHGITHKIKTGFAAIDRLIGGGLSLSDVLCVAGLPGCGKSAFALQMACNIAVQEIPIAFLSGEMSNRENVFRMISQVTKTTNLNAVSRLSEDELNFYNEWADAIKKLPLYFDAKTYDLQTLKKGLRSIVEEKGVQVLVIDYIQLLKISRFDTKQSRYERITEAAQEVKRLAMEFQIAIIEVAQFNREGAKSNKPSMHDLEGSSQLEKDVSLIFIIDRDSYDKGKITLRVVKGRNAGRSEIEGRFTGINLNFSFE